MIYGIEVVKLSLGKLSLESDSAALLEARLLPRSQKKIRDGNVYLQANSCPERLAASSKRDPC